MREGNKLTTLKVAKLIKEGVPKFHSDGGNLLLKISGPGNGSWVFRFMLHRGKRKDMGLGSVHTVNLQEARNRARQARQLLLEGKDPLAVKQDAITMTILDAARTMTFREAATQFLATDKVSNFKSDTHRKQWRSTLETYAFPVIGDLPLSKSTRRSYCKPSRQYGSALPKPAHASVGALSACLSGRVLSDISRVITLHN